VRKALTINLLRRRSSVVLGATAVTRRRRQSGVLKTALLGAIVACMLAFSAADGAARGPATLVVDRDRAQCANADFTSIDAAVDAAQPGDVIRVCPDLYAETVVVDKPLTLRGHVGAVEAADCFAREVEVDPTSQAIVDPPAGAFSIALKLEADDVVLRGFVVQGASVGIDASDRFSGYRVHHNLIRSNTLFGVDFGSEGAHPSRVDHNCIRENGWGLVSELEDDSLWKPSDGPERDPWNARDLTGARIDHNVTFRNTAGAEAAGPGRHDRVTFDHNVSRESAWGIVIQNSEQSRILHNELHPTLRGIDIGGANEGLEITGNLIDTGRQGIAFIPANLIIDQFPAPTIGALVASNLVTGQVLDGIVASANRLHQSQLLNNMTSDNGRDGIILRLSNSGNIVRGNVAERNGEYGIYAQGAVANLFEANRMLGNGVLDARDENRAANTWSGNYCLTDFPAGTICGVG
jgi:parallel beta-helix repeat protein